MDIKKFEVILKKINTLKQNIDLTGEEISTLELELLKNYIKKLYETVTPELADDDFEVSKPKKKRKKKNKSKKEVEVEYEEEEEIDEEPAPVIEETKAKTPEKKVEEAEQISVEEEPVVAPVQHDEKLLALFEEESSSELSQKLSKTPIKDMRKSMGINERIFTINELFGGDKELFNNSMGSLNEFNSFEEAKDFLLANLATKFEWAKPVNHKKVQQFIKLVKRRYA
jgi:hypothetical protein